ncbi:MAG TPA: TraB/GumN family protein [Candidatus Binatus sp.]|nr:TraB/GumN family protein [Candidatus Binatus sp.]
MVNLRKRFSAFRIGRLLICIGLLAHGAELGAQDKSLLWKVTAGKNNVYLLGSIHLLKKDTASSKPIIDEVFDKAQRLVFEIDISNESPEKTQQLFMQKGINLDGKTLQEKVSRETFQAATIWANNLGLDIKMLAPFKPWVAALTLMVVQLQKLGYDPNFGIDRQLAQRAARANKPVSGLESAEYQFDQLDRLSPAVQEMMLRQTLAEMEQIGKTVDDMVLAWRTGDVPSAEKLFLESMTDYPEFREKILDERNRNWLPKIDQFLKLDEDVLVVVGAAHLLGKSGVIELLKSRGYKMEQM